MADSKNKRLPKDFNHMKPDDLQITDPERAEREAAGIPVDREYPKHLHRFAGVGLPHEFVEVTNAKEEAAAEREGYGSAQDADADHREAAADAAPQRPASKRAAAKTSTVAAPAAPKAAAKKRAPAKPKAAKVATEPGESAAN